MVYLAIFTYIELIFNGNVGKDTVRPMDPLSVPGSLGAPKTTNWGVLWLASDRYEEFTAAQPGGSPPWDVKVFPGFPWHEMQK